MRLAGAFVLICGLCAAGPLDLTTYSAPAADRAAGIPNTARPFDAILPNGRILAPVGKSVAVAGGLLGLALTPDGRYAILSSGDERAGDALTVVDTATMHVAGVYSAEGARFFRGVVAFRDPADPARTLVAAAAGADDAVRLLSLDASGTLSLERAIPIAPLSDPGVIGARHAFPSALALSPDGRTLYAVDTIADTATAIDLRTRLVIGSTPVGFYPAAAAASSSRLYVSDEGLMQYHELPAPERLPQFVNPPAAMQQASALSVVPLSQGALAPPAFSLPMDPPVDGVATIGGAHPSSIALSKDGRYAYVCMTGVDRVAIVSLTGAPRVVGGLELRLYDRAPYGMQPDAIVRSADGNRLYVALAGLNAVAVLDARDPARLHRLGLIPAGWFPDALAVSASGRYLYVANLQAPGAGAGSTFERIDMHKLPLQKTTLSALRYERTPRRAVANPIVPPLRTLQRSDSIKHVVFLLEEGKTYADLAAMPNLRSLAAQYASATEMYAEGADFGTAHQFAAAGIATAYAAATALLADTGCPFDDGNQNPEDYPRAGYIFNNAQRAGLSYRDYGELLRVCGSHDGSYALDVPALAALGGHVDPRYPGWVPAVPDMQRAREFIADYAPFEKAGNVPDFTYIWLPGNDPVDSDNGLGAIVQFLTHQPAWSSTAIFITAADVANPGHTFAVIASPYAKRGYSGNAHLSTAGVLKTEEELLGLPPLSLDDLLATDMADFFTTQADVQPFTAVTNAAESKKGER